MAASASKAGPVYRLRSAPCEDGMAKLEVWIECQVTSKKLKVSDVGGLYARIRFRPEGDNDSVNYIELTATKDGGISIRSTEGVLSIKPQVSNEIYVYQQPIV